MTNTRDILSIWFDHMFTIYEDSLRDLKRVFVDEEFILIISKVDENGKWKQSCVVYFSKFLFKK